MAVRLQGALSILLIFSFGPLLGDAQAQPTGKWWTPVAGARGGGPPSTAHSGPRIPRGHLPPPGQCRLWDPGQPPGKQPPPISCREAFRRQHGRAYVITHRGAVHRGGRPARWHRRPAGDVVLRRPPREKGPVFDVDIIIDVLGRHGYRRLQARKRRLNVRGALRARWLSIGPSGGSVLQVRAGPYPLAELVDQNGDRRVESFFFWRRR
jgi:hypothetical protein